jgi:hypothetical protein
VIAQTIQQMYFGLRAWKQDKTTHISDNAKQQHSRLTKSHKKFRMKDKKSYIGTSQLENRVKSGDIAELLFQRYPCRKL